MKKTKEIKEKKKSDIAISLLGKKRLGMNLKKSIKLLKKFNVVVVEQRDPTTGSLNSFCQILTTSKDKSAQIKEKLKQSGTGTVQEYSPQTHPEVIIITAYRGCLSVFSLLV